jgi:Acyclic terpene utilisation family protein AtuA
MTTTNGHTNGRINGNDTAKRPIRIAGSSGGFTDRQRAIHSLAQCDVDVIVGDWMSECTMSWHGAAKSAILVKGDDRERPGLFDPSFMANVTPALPLLAEKGIKLAVNAGASDTEMLAKTMEKAIKDAGLSDKLKVAWIEGDEVLDVVNKLLKQGEKLENICFGGELKDWGFDPVAAQ